MINHLKLYEELKETIDPSAAKKIAEALKDIYEDLKSSIAREEFRELKDTLAGLSEGLLSFQRTTEENFNKVWASINELAEAQRRTEERVNELAEAQRRTEESLKSLEERFESFQRTTEENFNKVWASINELAEAQRRTEERVNELAEAQRRTEESLKSLEERFESFQRTTEENFNKVWASINELAEAQRRTEESLESFKRITEENFNKVWASIRELRDAQKDTEKVVNDLVMAQKETQQELKALARGLAETREMVGGLSDTVGYSLEDRAIKSLPSILKNKYGIIVTEGLVRKFIKYNGRHDEVNIFGTGKKDKRLITIIGEAKSRLSKKHIEDLLKLIERLRKAGVIKKEAFPIVVTYSAEPVVEEMAKEKGVNLIWSYEL